MKTKLIVLRVAKCGTTTIVKELVRQAGDSNTSHIGRGPQAANKFRTAVKLRTSLICVAPPNAGMVYDQIKHLREEAGYKLVSFQRNPYARFISSWAFCANGGNVFQYPLPKMSPWDLLQLRDYQLNEIQWAHTFQQQTDICRPGKVDYTIRTEELNSCFNELANDTGYNQRKLPHRNKSTHEPWESYYYKDSRLIQEVKRRFYHDIKDLPYDAPI